MTAAGFEHYEVSNFGLPGRRSRHNSSYWTGVPYLGVGPSAHGFDGRARRWNAAAYAAWESAVGRGDDPIEGSEAIGEAVTDPRLFGYSLHGSLTSGYKREGLEAYKKETTTVEASCYKAFRKFLTPSLNVQFEYAVVYDVASNDPSAPQPDATKFIFVEPRFVVDNTDDKFYPTKGWYGIVGVGVSSKIWLSDDDLVRNRLQTKGFISITPGWVVALNLALEDIEPFGNTSTFPSTQLLFAGGNDTVRGFPLDALGPLDSNGNPLGGRTQLIGNIELRFPIYNLIHGVIFVDAGSISDGLDTIDLRWAAGGGVRVHTPVGPVRVEYGYQLQDNPPLDRGEFHFSLGFPF